MRLLVQHGGAHFAHLALTELLHAAQRVPGVGHIVGDENLGIGEVDEIGRRRKNPRNLETLVDYETATPKVTEAVTILGEVGVLMEVAGTCGFPSCVVREVTPFVPWRPRSTMDAHHRSARTEDPTPCQRCAVAGQCIRPRREYLQVHGERGLVPYAEVPASDWYQRLAALPLAARWGTLDQLLEADPSNSGNLTLR